MRVVIAPDKYKGTASARVVAEAMGRGVVRAWPDADVALVPMADGGEGTVEALVSALGGRTTRHRVTGPLGAPVQGFTAQLSDGRVVLEMASSSGLALVPDHERDPLLATSYGTGELMLAALRMSPAQVLVGLGGSASTDGGSGAARAAGWRFLDARGNDLPPGGGALGSLRRIDDAGVLEEMKGARIQGVTDVGSPLLGPRGAAAVFGPQKGASATEIEVLEKGLATLSSRIHTDLGKDVAVTPGAGAAGGMGAGLIAFFDAHLVGGFETVAEAANLKGALRTADLVITGEGHLDRQSLGGKVPIGVARLARDAGVECLAVCGRVSVPAPDLASHGISRALGLEDELGAEQARAHAAASIAEVTARLLASHRGM